MPYNDDQLFYAALWWSACLDGAEAYLADTFKAYGKKPIAIEPIKKPNKHYNGPPVTPEQFQTYFYTLYESLGNNKADLSRPTREPGSRFIQLSSEGYSSGRPERINPKTECQYSSAIEAAIAASRIDRKMHSHAKAISIHDTGQIFVAGPFENFWAPKELFYPNRPALDFKSCPRFYQSDMTDVTLYMQEAFSYVLPLKPGQEFTHIECGETRKYTALENQALVVYSTDSNVHLHELIDDDVLNGSFLIKRNQLLLNVDEVTPGFVEKRDSDYGPYTRKLESTDHPRIVRDISGPVKVMKVTEKIAIGTGLSFAIARPGDLIVADGGYSISPVIVRKSQIDAGQWRFMPYLRKEENPQVPQSTPLKPRY